MKQMLADLKIIRNDLHLLIRKLEKIENNICLLENTFNEFETKYQEVMEENVELKNNLEDMKIKSQVVDLKCDICENKFQTKWKLNAHRRLLCG